MAGTTGGQSSGIPPNPGPEPQPSQFSGRFASTQYQQALATWQQQEDAYNAAVNYQNSGGNSGVNNDSSGGSNGKGKTYTYTIDPTTGIIHRSDGEISKDGVNFYSPTTTSGTPGNTPGSTGVSTGMTAYEQAQVGIDKQRLADAEAQQKADQQYREAQAVDAWTKNWQDFQTKHYYGSIAGPAYAAPAGAPNWWKMPEPTYIQDYYKNNPQAGPDPWNQPNPYSGYSGSLFLNPQQPGVQNQPPIGSTVAPNPAQANQPAGSPQAGTPPAGQPSTQVAPTASFNPAVTNNQPTTNPAAQPQQQAMPPAGQPLPTGGGMKMSLDPNLLNMVSSHPAANQFVMSLPGAQDYVNQMTGGMGINPQTGPSSPFKQDTNGY